MPQYDPRTGTWEGVNPEDFVFDPSSSISFNQQAARAGVEDQNLSAFSQQHKTAFDNAAGGRGYGGGPISPRALAARGRVSPVAAAPPPAAGGETPPMMGLVHSGTPQEAPPSQPQLIQSGGPNTPTAPPPAAPQAAQPNPAMASMAAFTGSMNSPNHSTPQPIQGLQEAHGFKPMSASPSAEPTADQHQAQQEMASQMAQARRGNKPSLTGLSNAY